jgi:hypothetical protein
VLRRDPLPAAVERLRAESPTDLVSVHPVRLGRIVRRVLRLGPIKPRCLTASLVLYQLLRGQGEQAQLVIGLPRTPVDKRAHAWVEIEGVDVGPPPGRAGHVELARYG